MTTLTCTITKNGRSDEFGRALTQGQSYTGAFDFVRALYMAGYASVADASVFDDDDWQGAVVVSASAPSDSDGRPDGTIYIQTA